MWTIESVKSELPNVKVKPVSGPNKIGVVRGRKNKFATVLVADGPFSGFEVAWDTIVNCLNNDRPIRL